MSKAKDSKQNHPNVVAKLMGLEALSKGEINLSVEKGHRKYYSPQHLQMEDGFVDKEMLHEVFTSTEQNNAQNNGVHKTWLESLRTSHDEDFVDVAKMAFIQQKFMEAKVMSTDERLRNSKQFKDALEVLSSNSDLLIKLLNSHEYPYQLNSTPPAETRKHITLLKPLMVDSDKFGGKGKRKKKNDEPIKKPEIANQTAAWSNKINLGYSAGNQKVDEALVQSTRIVVLKPNSGKTHEDHDDEVVIESRIVAKEIITQQVHETLYPSSVISNCYSCDDESLFSKSYHGYKDGNFTDFDVMSQRHSLDHHINNDHCGSSSLYYSTLSLGGGTCSPESSVCIEAKRRLYERWTMMKSNSDKHPQQEQMHHHVRRKSTTLGEMLSFFKIKKFVTTSEAEISTNEEEQEEKRNSVSCRHFIKQEVGIHGFHENHDDDGGKSHGFSKVLTKSKSMSSLFRGKVSNFLFSRKKKSPTNSKDESQCSFTETSSHTQANSERVLKDDDLSQSFNSNGFQECSVPDLCESLGKTSSDSVSIRQKQAMINLEPGLIVPKAESSIENQDQPSPISVLETPFEDDSHESLDCMKSDNHGSLVPQKSNLIDKSPPIESIARTLSWGGSCADSSSSLDTKSEQQEWLILVEKLLSASGFHDDQVLQQYDPFNSTRWHSLESPLDPSLRDKYANLSENDHHHHHHHLSESKRRKMRSNQKLVFDCVNAALLEFGPPEKYLIINNKGRVKSGGGHIMLPPQQVQEGATCHLFLDHIVAKMKELIMANGGGVRCDFGGDDCGNSNSLVVENVVRNEVVGINWIEHMELEIDILVREIESELIQEIVEDAVVDFTCRA